jgi:ankyrin repeat protein
MAYGKCVQANPDPVAFEKICTPKRDNCLGACASASLTKSGTVGASRAASTKTTSLPKKYAAPSKVTTLFWDAFKNKNYEMMDLLLKQGADLDCANCSYLHRTALMITTEEALRTSIYFGFGEEMRLMEFLIERGADINFRDDAGRTALMLAAGKPNGANKTRLINRLLEAGADTSLFDTNGNSILIEQVGSGYRGDNLNDFNHWLLNVKLFASRGIDINHQNNLGMTALMYSAAGCGYDGAKNLLALGADPDIKTPTGDTALSLAIEAAAKKQASCNQVVRLLADPSANTEALSDPSGAPIGTKPVGGLVESLRGLNESLRKLGRPQ